MYCTYRPAVYSGGDVYVSDDVSPLPSLLVPLDPRWLCQCQLLLRHYSGILPGSGIQTLSIVYSCITAVSLLLQVFLVSDVMYSFLVHRYDLCHGLPRVDSHGHTIALALR